MYFIWIILFVIFDEELGAQNSPEDHENEEDELDVARRPQFRQDTPIDTYKSHIINLILYINLPRWPQLLMPLFVAEGVRDALVYSHNYYSEHANNNPRSKSSFTMLVILLIFD